MALSRLLPDSDWTPDSMIQLRTRERPKSAMLGVQVLGKTGAVDCQHSTVAHFVGESHILLLKAVDCLRAQSPLVAVYHTSIPRNRNI